MCVCLSVKVAGGQQGVNLLAAVSVLITTDVCCKRIAAGNKDTMVSAAVPWCDSIRQENAYWQGEKGERTERERDRQREQSVLESVTLALTQCHESPHHYSSNCTGTLFKLKHIPEAECQQKDAHYHTCTRALCTSMHTWDSYWLRENELTTWILLFRPVVYQVRSKTVGGIHLLKSKNNTKPGPWICLIYRNFDRNRFNVE